MTGIGDGHDDRRAFGVDIDGVEVLVDQGMPSPVDVIQPLTGAVGVCGRQRIGTRHLEVGQSFALAGCQLIAGIGEA